MLRTSPAPVVATSQYQTAQAKTAIAIGQRKNLNRSEDSTTSKARTQIAKIDAVVKIRKLIPKEPN
jgi:hypothetical protein